MKNVFVVAALIAFGTSVLSAAGVPDYRGFQWGTDLPAAARRAAVDPAKVRTVYQRPELIQELEWQPSMADPGDKDPVREVLLSFSNGKLFRIVVTYDRYKVQGMTADDMIAGISLIYGSATRPGGKIAYHSLFTESASVLARWENEQSVYSLADIGNGNFALILYSKTLDAPAQAAIAESIRLDAIEAPQREIEKQKQNQIEAQLDLEKKRSANKANFRP